MSAGSARLVAGPGGGRVQAVFKCACGSLEIAARGLCSRCLARQHHDLEYLGGYREHVLELASMYNACTILKLQDSISDSSVYEAKLKSLEGWTRVPTEEIVLPEQYVKVAEPVTEGPK